MPHLKSAKKRLRQSKTRRARNRAVLSDVRTQIKRVLRAVKDQKVAEAKDELKIAQKKLDKCGARHYLHPNTAKRLKSRLAHRVQVLETSAKS